MTQPMTMVETVRGTGRGRIAHAEDPRRRGVALCGAKLGGIPVSATAHRCVVCLDLARPTFVGR
jgi:hypothetical protein